MAIPGLLAVMLVLLLTAPAYASYEMVQTFGEGLEYKEPQPTGPQVEESVSGSGAAGVAVNDATGDVYVADQPNQRVIRFDAKGHFREAWGWGVGDGKLEYQRCGPEGEIANCKGYGNNGIGQSGEGVGQFAGPQAIAIDQSTGDVYVASGRDTGVIQVFSGKGSLITSFGENSAMPVSASREMMHGGDLGENDMVVDPETGDVYVFDARFSAESRVMVFRPKAPDRHEYEYAEELFTGEYSNFASALAEDASGDFYLSHDAILYKFDKGNFTTPAWEKSVPEGAGMVVEPSSGDLLRYATHSTKIQRYNAANGEVTESFSTSEAGTNYAELANVNSLALNPDLVWSPGRPPGVLYGDVGLRVGTKRPSHMVAFAQLPVTSPKVDSESASFIGSSSGTLIAQINPEGYRTRYRFQYGTEPCSSHPCAEAPLGGADLGAGSTDLAAGVELSGLAPETTYYYRVLATNLYGSTVEGAEQTFATYPVVAPGLPDGRIYEMVSPAEKAGGEVFSPDPGLASCKECKPGENSARDPMQSAPDGNAVVYEGGPFAQTGDAIEQNEYLSRRTATGWRTEDQSPAVDPAGLPYAAVSDDLSAGVLPWQAGDPLLSPEAPSGYENIYLREAGGNIRPLLTTPPPGAQNEGALNFVGAAAASADFRHVVFGASYALTSETPFAPPAMKSTASNKYNLYEWFDGQLRLVNVLPGNATTVPDATLGEWKEGYEAVDDTNAVSKDGSRIFWTDQETGQVYVRVNGESTLEIPDTAPFLSASSDGLKVLLRDGLIFDLSSGTPVESANLGDGLEGFQGTLGANEDFSRVYFVDTEVLTGEEQNDQGAVAQTGGDNVYLYEAASGSTRFVATLVPADNSALGDSLAGDWKPSASDRLAQVTPDGRYLAFMSQASLTGYQNKGVSEVFEYDAETGRLACASCNPAGVAPLGGSKLTLISVVQTRFPQPRNLSDDGRVFFDSGDVLSPFDGNGSIEDVYEYEPEGVGTCARSGGCISLISSGHSPADSNFLAASPSGGDVFFTTRDRLVPVDQDQLYDLYDARVDGGFAELTAPSCTGSGCQGVPGAPPIFATPSSVTFAGVGNFDASTGTEAPSGKPKAKKKPAKCPKGKKLKGGRCVKVRAGKSTAHRARSKVHKARSRDVGTGGSSGGARK